MTAIAVILICLYVTPLATAAINHHRQVVAIGALNLLLGWTFVGWVVALVWALTK